MNVLEFAAAIAWPAVALIALLILGLSDTLPKSVDRLAGSLLSIKSSVEEFKQVSEKFNDRQRAVNESLEWLSKADSELSRISDVLKSIQTNTDDIALSQGDKEISEVVGDEEEVADADSSSKLNAQQRYNDIHRKWAELKDRMELRIGADDYDGRAIGAMARTLAHQNRIMKKDAELIETLHSQFKRFARMSRTKEEWLTREIYENFIRGVDRALKGLI
ncbi:hypothetical protein Q4610_02245 [Sphingobium sp. HBC34]|uniref:Uncharacterized protein n=1 Tax=Sphingobium cyanobacteriorum TaxID=3063954 RepID=A0ABT8ZH44_9SPHN|nr:hypothetical protein [Sphingobium sp. HBC34]MDO7833855.1 hypothetical protein [Sphingobium sp. HBC34]